MKKIFPAIVALLIMAGCNNNPPKTEEKPAETTTTTPAETKPAFTPYKGRAIEVTVKDFDKWYAMFNSSDSLYKAYGLTNPGVARIIDNDKKVLVFADVADVAKAKEYDNSDARKEAMKKSGVANAAKPSYWDIIMDDTTAIPQQERLWVTHHVKDFDTWKKAYDAEGDASRAEHGLVQRMMARGIEDPNMVTIFFAITDMAKAKARVNSPELKKVMTDAGVDGAPQIVYFKWVK